MVYATCSSLKEENEEVAKAIEESERGESFEKWEWEEGMGN